MISFDEFAKLNYGENRAAEREDLINYQTRREACPPTGGGDGAEGRRTPRFCVRLLPASAKYMSRKFSRPEIVIVAT